MTLPPSVRKLTYTTHVIASVGWIGALAVFFAHALAGLLGQDEQLVRAVSLAMGITAWLVILPLSVTSLATGLVQALGTAWGLLRHYWVLFKLVLTATATLVLLLKLAPISYLAEAASRAAVSAGDLAGLRTSIAVHAAGGLLVLLTAAVLAVYKPQGMTAYGRRKLRQRVASAGDPGSAISTPRWAKIFAAVLAALMVAVAVMSVLGGHGPGAHMPSGEQ
jgi:putative copper export protein